MKDEIIKFKKRWAIANAAEIRELRASSLSEKAHQTAALMESAKKLGWTELHDPEEKQVRERWNALRKKQGK